MAYIYLAVEITVYAAEINVVLARRLWPRSIVQPPLTEADRASMALQALQNQRREEQHIEVSFHDRPPGDPRPGQHPADARGGRAARTRTRRGTGRASRGAQRQRPARQCILRGAPGRNQPRRGGSGRRAHG